MAAEHFDVLIIGAGLSGIGAAHHLQTLCPGRSYAILESRDRLGGTWDLFRYPGVRSDSDMYTLGYAFRPWQQSHAIASGSSILQYLQDTAAEGGIQRHIRFGHRVRRASWSTLHARWTVEAERGSANEPVLLSCNFLFMCSGYYRYDAGYTPDFPGTERFRGRIVHPQQWSSDIDYTGKRVVVIGSGATAVTLVPALAARASHVTMLQRSPSYMVALPSKDVVANGLRRLLPAKVAHTLTRWKQILLVMATFGLARSRPALMTRLLLAGVRMSLGRGYDVATHFTPRYKPWEQRLCLVPDGDLFKAIRSGRASVVTDRIETFTENGIRLASGQQLEADLVVTATGLRLQLLGGVQLTVDGQAVDLPNSLNYKGLMFSGVPNLASTFGYTNASWTLRSDLNCEYVCRLLNHMQRRQLVQCTPRLVGSSVTPLPWVDFSSGYFQRAAHLFPRQGSRAPWKLHQNYIRDIWMLRHGTLDDGVLEFATA